MTPPHDARDQIRAALNECLEDGATPAEAAEQVLIGTSAEVLRAYVFPLVLGEARGLARELEHEVIAHEVAAELPPEAGWR